MPVTPGTLLSFPKVMIAMKLGRIHFIINLDLLAATFNKNEGQKEDKFKNQEAIKTSFKSGSNDRLPLVCVHEN
jgi:hypothetical protein